MAPRPQTSAAGPASSARACSGARYPADPITAPGTVPVIETGGVYALATNIGRHGSNDWVVFPEVGATLGWRWTALDSVGLYVPGGTASYPSSVLMNAVPARVAGVRRIAMVTPASGGKINPLTLAAAKRRAVLRILEVEEPHLPTCAKMIAQMRAALASDVEASSNAS